MASIDKMMIQEKLDVAQFYADRNAGKVIELRKNKAAISTPAGLEHLEYWWLRAYKHEHNEKYQGCLAGIGKVFERLKGFSV